MVEIVTLTMNPALDIATASDIIEPSRKLRCEAPCYDPGGGGINVARGTYAGGRRRLRTDDRKPSTRGRELAEVVRFGVAAGSAALLCPGTELCRRENTKRLYRELAPA